MVSEHLILFVDWFTEQSNLSVLSSLFTENTLQAETTEQYRTGYSACATEVLHYFGRTAGMQEHTRMRTLDYLQGRFATRMTTQSCSAGQDSRSEVPPMVLQAQEQGVRNPGASGVSRSEGPQSTPLYNVPVCRVSGPRLMAHEYTNAVNAGSYRPLEANCLQGMTSEVWRPW